MPCPSEDRRSAARDVEGDVLLLQAARADGARVLAAVPGVEHDARDRAPRAGRGARRVVRDVDDDRDTARAWRRRAATRDRRRRARSREPVLVASARTRDTIPSSAVRRGARSDVDAVEIEEGPRRRATGQHLVADAVGGRTIEHHDDARRVAAGPGLDAHDLRRLGFRRRGRGGRRTVGRSREHPLAGQAVVDGVEHALRRPERRQRARAPPRPGPDTRSPRPPGKPDRSPGREEPAPPPGPARSGAATR